MVDYYFQNMFFNHSDDTPVGSTRDIHTYIHKEAHVEVTHVYFLGIH